MILGLPLVRMSPRLVESMGAEYPVPILISDASPRRGEPDAHGGPGQPDGGQDDHGQPCPRDAERHVDHLLMIRRIILGCLIGLWRLTGLRH